MSQQVEYLPPEYDFARCRTRQNPNGPYFEKDVIEAIRVTSGVISEAANLLGRSRTGLNVYIQKHSNLMEMLNDYRESLVDLAEKQIHFLVSEGDPGSVRFVLSTLGRYRGWSLKDWQKEDENPDVPKVQIMLPDNGREAK